MLKKLLYFGASRLAIVGAQLLFIPIAVSQLGVSGYGKYNLLLQGALLIKIFALQGVAQSVTREYAGLSKIEEISIIYSSSVIYIFAAVVITFLLLVPFASGIATSFELTSNQVLLAMIMAMSLAFFGIKHILIYNFNFTSYTSWDIAQAIGVTSVLLISGYFFPSVAAYQIAYVAGTLGLAVFMLRSWSLTLPPAKYLQSFGLVLFRYGAPLMLTEGLAWVINVADRFQIASTLGARQTGIYAAAYQLFVAPCNMLGYAVALIIQPGAFASEERQYKLRMEQSAILLCVVATSWLTFATLFGKPLFSIFFKHQADISLNLIVILSLTGIANSFLYLEAIAGKYIRNTKVLLIAQFLGAILILLGNWILIPRIGIIAAASTSLSAYVIQIVFIRAMFRKNDHFRYYSLEAVSAISGNITAGFNRAIRKG